MTADWSYDAVIVHYRAPHLLQTAINSLHKQTVRPGRIIVVDNSGDLEYDELLSGKEIALTLLSPGDNLGYAAAMNLGAKESKNGEHGGPTHLLFMTQDVTLERTTCSDLARAFEDRKVGCSAPVLYRTSQPSTVYSAGGILHAGGQVRHLNVLEQRKEHFSVDWVDGALMLVSMPAFAEASGFNEQYFLYYEEVDLCQRLSQAGYSTVVVNTARSWQEPGNYTPYLRMRNQILFCKSFDHIAIEPRTLIYQLARTAAGSCMRRKPSGILWAVIGTYHGLAGVGGKPPVSLRSALVNIVRNSRSKNTKESAR